MIPVEWQIKVPAGIDDASARALTQIIEERLGGVPIERVLVWHTDSVVEGALAHLAELFDVDMVAHGVDKTRVLLEQAFERLRRRGTCSAVEETLWSLGLDGAFVKEETVLRHGGAIVRDGTHRHGYDGQWAVFWIIVEAGTGDVSYPTIERLTKKNKRRSSHLGAVFAVTDMSDALGSIVGWYRPGLAGLPLATEDGDVLTDEDGHPLIMLEVS